MTDQVTQPDPSVNRILQGKCLIVITGANRGFGKALAHTFWQAVQDSNDQTTQLNSKLLLYARKASDLTPVKAALLERSPGAQDRIYFQEADMSSFGEEAVTAGLTEVLGGESFDQLIVFHNAASLGEVSRTSDTFKSDEFDNYFHLNLSSMVTLNTILFNTVRRTSTVVVHVSSICAVQPTPCMPLYCSGKAARDMFFRCLASERPKDVKVLNYAPGPMQTAMFATVSKDIGDQQMQDVFAGIKPLTCEESTQKLLKILMKNEFTSGAHVDFYDVPDVDEQT